MKFFIAFALMTAANAFAFDTMVCNVNLMKVDQGEFLPSGSNLFESVATKTFAQSHGASMTANSAVFLYDETVNPANPPKRYKPKKEEVVINVASLMKSWENDESLMIVLYRASEKNKHGVHTKVEELGRIELKEMGKSQVTFVDKYAVQMSCNVVDKP